MRPDLDLSHIGDSNEIDELLSTAEEERVSEILNEKEGLYSQVLDGLVDDLSEISKELLDEREA